MDRFTADSPTLFSFNRVENVAVVIILLQLTATASCSAGILPDLHHHPPSHHPHVFEYPVRWTKPPHGQYHRRPVDVMTDVINDLGVKILDKYIENTGNVGFSPSGLGFVVVALYEGSAGSSGRQIGEVLGLPNDRRITRIGMRDIHRRLRSYLNADAFLGGLTLNRDDINLRPEYEDILRFYGFDISDAGNTTAENRTPDGVSLTVTAETDAASILAGSTDAIVIQMTTQPSTLNPTTINDAEEIITSTTDDRSSTLAMGSTSASASMSNVTMTDTIASTTTTSATSMPSSTLADTPSATSMTSMMIMSIVQAIMNTMNASTTTRPTERLVGPPTIAEMQTRRSDDSTLSLGASSSDSIATTSPMTTIVTMSMAALTNDSMMQRLISTSTQSAAELQTKISDGSTSVVVNDTVGRTIPIIPATNLTTVAATNSTDATSMFTINPIPEATMNSTTNGTTSPTTNHATNVTTSSTTNLMMAATMNLNTDATTSPTTPPINLLTLPMTTMMTSLTMMPESMGDSEFTNGTVMNSSMTTQMEMTTNAGDAITNTIRKRRSVLQGPSGYFSSSADDNIWLDVYGRLNINDDYQSQDDEIVENPSPSTQLDFLVNGCDYSRVTAATYTAVLPFAYFPSLRTSILEFPLDDPRYKILVMLPSESNGTRRLARILTTKSITLRHLRHSLQSTWVTAIIPSFMLRGFVTLTPYLQRLGISDVFEPRTADLSPMSPDLGVYARDIQQSIGVNIRNNMNGGIGGAGSGNGDQRQPPRPINLARGTRGVFGLPPFFTAGGAISPRSLGNIHYSPYSGGAGPIPFIVDRPFLYFIIDDQTSVSLLAGRIDDPLNSRIML